MNSSHLFLQSTNQRSILQQKVSFLQEQLQEYRQKQSKLNRLNESILQTYKENENHRQSREEKLQKEIKQLGARQRQEIRKLKSQFNKEKAQMENENCLLKENLKQMEVKLEQIKLLSDKNMLEMKMTLEKKHEKYIDQVQNNHKQKVQELELQIHQLVKVNELYKEYVERKQQEQQDNSKQTKKIPNGGHYIDIREKQNFKKDQSDQKFNLIIDKQGCLQQAHSKQANLHHFLKQTFLFKKNDCIYSIRQNNQVAKKVVKESKKLINQLNCKINRAIREIHHDRKPSCY